MMLFLHYIGRDGKTMRVMHKKYISYSLFFIYRNYWTNGSIKNVI